MTLSLREKIIEYLQTHPEGVDDEALTKALGVPYRQEVNTICRKLVREGIVERRPMRGTMHNFLVGQPMPVLPHTGRDEAPNDVLAHLVWFWEGNVQARVVAFLKAQGYEIRSSADTASHEQGKDIIAERNGSTLWVTVKGYPRATEKVQPSLQASHWFSAVVFDILKYRNESDSVGLGMALPDFPRYRRLASKIAWLQPVARFTYYWVQSSGEVVVEG